MKTKLLSIYLFFASFLVYSQEILLSFNAEDENTNSINLETIEVENITTGNTITVNTKFPFNLSGAVLSADSFSLKEMQQGIQNVFPNPTNAETNITFYNASKQENTVQVYDVVGKEVAKLTKVFSDGLQTVKFVPNTTGVFFIKLTQQSKIYQSKIIVTKSISSNAKLEAVKIGKKEKLQKKTAEPFFNIGDELKFTTLYKGVPHSITDTPTANKTYTFNLNSAFYFAENGVTIKAYDDVEVGTKTNFNGAEYTLVDREALDRLIENDEDITKVVTTGITNMDQLFFNKNSFNQDISAWDVSSVTQMIRVFEDASSFNQDISSWDTSNVEYMQSLFSGATSFNQDISAWDVSNVTDMLGVFENASSFNQNISNWNVCNVSRYVKFSDNTSENWTEDHKPNFGDPEKCSGN